MIITTRQVPLIVAVFLLVFVFAAPGVVFAEPVSPVKTLQTAGADITVEYRYTEGEEASVGIPDTIERYGKTYRIKDRQPAVRETTLPATRTYTWAIDGFVTEEQAAKLLSDFPGLVLTPVMRDGKESQDLTRTITGLPTNDVDAIPYTITEEQSEYRRAAVRFEIEKDENGAPAYDAFGLPASYKAEVVYRGLAGTRVPGYYTAAQTYETKEALAGVAQYVIVTTYSPVPAAAAGATATTTAATGSTGGGLPDAPEEITDPIAIGSLAEESPPDTDASGETTTLTDEKTPLAAGSFSERAETVFFTVLKVIAVCAAAFAGFILALILRNKIRRMRKARRMKMEYNNLL